MTEYFTLHKILRNKTDSQSQILRQNLLYYIDHTKKQEIIYSYAKKECLLLDDEICLYLKRSLDDQSSLHISLNYPQIKTVVKTDRNSLLYHSQSINLDNLFQAQIKQEATLILSTTSLKDIVFIFKSRLLAQQWKNLINQKIKENWIFRKKRDQYQKNLTSFNYTISDLVSKIYEKDDQISRQVEEVKTLQRKIDNIKKSQIHSSHNIYQSCVMIDNNNDETVLNQEKYFPSIKDQAPNIINYMFKQIIKRNQLISLIKADNNNLATSIKISKSNFFTNKQDLIQNMTVKLSKILQKNEQQVFKILMFESQ